MCTKVFGASIFHIIVLKTVVGTKQTIREGRSAKVQEVPTSKRSRINTLLKRR
jgi:hypothetical protein